MRNQSPSGRTELISKQIVSILRSVPGSLVSGEALSAQLGVTRTAVWKHIGTLRKLGYIIDSVPSRGYCLVSSPDLLLPSEILEHLNPIRLGKPLHYFTEVDSTNLLAFRMAEDGAGEGTTVVAERQFKGKGRLGRVWASPEGVNLYCSIVLRPAIRPTTAPQLTFISVVAVARAIERLCGLTPRIKWPNDLLLNGKKVAGLLNEMSAETDSVNFVILGIGVNLNMRHEQFPADLRHPATSLMLEYGQPVDRTLFARFLFEEIDQLSEQFFRRVSKWQY